MTHSPHTVADRLYLRWATALDKPDGGFSAQVRGGEEVTPVRGYAVSAYPECNRQLIGPVDPHHIRSYVIEHTDILQQAGSLLGGWRDPETGIAHLDVSKICGNRDYAMALAREFGELAIWDFAAGESVRV